MAPRFYCPAPLVSGTTINLPATAVRHVQVLRLQPGDPITLFGATAQSGDIAGLATSGGEFDATIAAMGRQSVQAHVGAHHQLEREASRNLVLAIGMPANDRMDWLVEKATELGVAAIQPLMTERSVVRLDDERARKKTAHWKHIAVAACEQCGRNRVPSVMDAKPLSAWTRQPMVEEGGARLILSLRPDAAALRQMIEGGLLPVRSVTLLVGPEGGLSGSEEELATAHGFRAVSLGGRVFRSETAALVALTLLA